MCHLVRVTLSIRCRCTIGGILTRISAILFVSCFSRGHDAPPVKAPMMCRRRLKKVRSRSIKRRLLDGRDRRSREGNERYTCQTSDDSALKSEGNETSVEGIWKKEPGTDLTG